MKWFAGASATGISAAHSLGPQRQPGQICICICLGLKGQLGQTQHQHFSISTSIIRNRLQHMLFLRTLDHYCKLVAFTFVFVFVFVFLFLFLSFQGRPKVVACILHRHIFSTDPQVHLHQGSKALSTICCCCSAASAAVFVTLHQVWPSLCPRSQSQVMVAPGLINPNTQL